MPAVVYRIIEVLSVIVMDLPIGTNLAVFHLIWMVMSGRLLDSRGAIIPTLSASGLATEAVRRAWAALAYGAWEVTQLLANFQDLVRQEGRRQRHWCGRLRPVAIDHVGFFRPRLIDCPTTHYHSQAGKASPAIPFACWRPLARSNAKRSRCCGRLSAGPTIRPCRRQPKNSWRQTSIWLPSAAFFSDKCKPLRSTAMYSG